MFLNVVHEYIFWIYENLHPDVYVYLQSSKSRVYFFGFQGDDFSFKVCYKCILKVSFQQ